MQEAFHTHTSTHEKKKNHYIFSSQLGADQAPIYETIRMAIAEWSISVQQELRCLVFG